MSIPRSGEWARVHPVSPLVRGWIALAAIAFVFGRNLVEDLIGVGRDDGGGGGGRTAPAPDGTVLLIGIGILAAILLIIAAVFFLSWWFTRYQVTDDHVRVHSGVVFRQQRQARLDRVQAIDIVQPLLARLFGLAELRFEVADAGESAVRLAFLKLDDAQQLRTMILDRASGAAEAGAGGEDADVPPGGRQVPGPVEAPEQPILELRPGRVIAATLLSGTTLFLLAGVAGVTILTAVTGEAVSLAILFPLLFGAVGGYWTEFSTSFNFRASVSRDGIRVRYGLLDTRTQTVPPGRIQAVAVKQSPLWRLTGWYRVSVNVAGYGDAATSEGQARTKLLPAGTLEEVFAILALVLLEPGTDRPLDVFTAGIAGRDSGDGFTTTPRRARWIAPLAWRRNGFALTETALLVRSGALWRALSVVPHERTQSMSLEQGPLRRRFGTADLVLHSTPGPVHPRIRKIDAATVRGLFLEQAVRAREARRRDRSGRWNQATGSGPVDPGSINPHAISNTVSKEHPHEQR
ncbi:PH domain-containing protein [Arthrobacter sp. zg-Y820]|uniref:PH domain-containing protein n=1 Tax=unclassified Arthrobacter TaxID=235627 RepID=UPI002541BE88|nr:MULTISPECIES: PH domain-containing protein [unclassified Arthrobacter]MCC9197456.1 PH domain-containing protein [Arthrobacter sp. zg-Y820]MDK1280323.1 PH domain-containing protein [Arthrobacter sp. zg.Y820]WIB09609.1 PH domain-containing protein [Arthrobacter sp. zg-Y820]